MTDNFYVPPLLIIPNWELMSENTTTSYEYYEEGPGGCKKWYRGGEFFKLETPQGCQYYRNGKIHREDGPASDLDNIKCWYIDGVRHRTDGPAIIMNFPDGLKHQAWYYEGKWISCSSQEEFETLMSLRAFW